jgi:hypothetical protein
MGVSTMRRNLKPVSFAQGAVKEVREEFIRYKVKDLGINLGNVASGIQLGFTSPDEKE